jgi:hypothetical protein
VDDALARHVPASTSEATPEAATQLNYDIESFERDSSIGHEALEPAPPDMQTETTNASLADPQSTENAEQVEAVHPLKLNGAATRLENGVIEIVQPVP